MPAPEPPRVTAVVLAYGEEPWLVEAVDSVLASTGVVVDVVLVDNGCTGDGVRRLEGRPGVQVVRPAENLGFAGGVDEGAAHATGDLLAMVNSDARVAPDALARLAAAVADPAVGIATACVRLADRPDRVNSAGNPLHVLGMVWAGGFGDPATEHAEVRDVACASGATAVMTRAWWEELGGFAPEYFAYHEDVDLSWRTWQRGRRVVYVPEAVSWHHYEFSRTATKHYLLERNRLLFLLTAHQRRTLLLLAPLLVGSELGLLVLAAAQGWWRQKLAGWRWLATHGAWVRERRRRLQAERTVPDRELAGLITPRFDAGHEATPAVAPALDLVVSAWWWVARRLL